jgi:hypothetical protein
MDLTEKLERIFCRFSFKTYTFQVQHTDALFRSRSFAFGASLEDRESCAPEDAYHFSPVNKW